MKVNLEWLRPRFQVDEEVPFGRFLILLGIFLISWRHLWEYSWKSANFRLWGRFFDLDLFARTGVLGVDILFFGVGFCLFYPYVKSWSQDQPGPGIIRFYLSTGLKYLPGYFLALLIMTFFFNLNGFSTPGQYMKNLFSHLFFIHPFNYNHFGSINSVLWIYGILIHFILIMPFLAWLFKRQPLLIPAACLVISFVFRMVLQSRELPGHNFYVWLCQVPGLLNLVVMGMLAAWLYGYVKQKKIQFFKGPLFFTIESILLFVLLGYMLQWLDFSDTIPVGTLLWRARYRDLLGILLVGLSFTSSFAGKYYRMLFDNPVINFFYLAAWNFLIWHQALGVFLIKHNIPWAMPPNRGQDRAWQNRSLLICIVFSFIISIVISLFLDRPLARLGAKGRDKQPVL